MKIDIIKLHSVSTTLNVFDLMVINALNSKVLTSAEVHQIIKDLSTDRIRSLDRTERSLERLLITGLASVKHTPDHLEKFYLSKTASNIFSFEDGVYVFKDGV